MSKHICAECKYQYFMLYKPKLKCMNEDSDRYGEDVEPYESCEKWEDMRGADDGEDIQSKAE